MAFIAPKFRRDSWYGQLYLRAYGADRGWLVRLKRLTFSTGFDYAPCPEFSAGTPEAEFLGPMVDWRRRTVEAYDRSLVFLMAPPPVQPFVEDGPPCSICPTFWKIVFALLVYCPIVALRWAWRVFMHALRATLAAIASAFRWTRKRYGRPLAWTTAGAAMLAMYGGLLYGLWAGSSATAEHWLVTEPRAEAQLAEAREQLEREREQLRQDSLARCTKQIRADAKYAALRTTQPDVECPSAYRSSHASHEEYARQCIGNDERHLAAIEAVEGGSLRCATDGWGNSTFERLFSIPAEQKGLAAWLAAKLRERFADELKVETAARARRIAEARKEDAKVVGVATAELVLMQHDPTALYRRFAEFCEFDEYAKTWEVRRPWGGDDGMTDATCATLAGLFEKQIEKARSAARWQGIRTDIRAGAPTAGMVIGAILGFVLLILAIIALLERYAQPFLHWNEWFFDRVALPFLGWTVIIATAPIWIPVRYLIWPTLCLIARSFRSVGAALWNVWLVRTVRSAFVSVCTGIASGVRRFAVATRQVLADTWHLIRAFASAKWERLCPFIQWE